MNVMARLAQLPRDTRDTLFLLLLIGWTLGPHLLRQPLWLAALTLGVLVWRGVLAWRQAPLPGRGLLIGLLVLMAGLTWWSERNWLSRDASVMLLVTLMTLKTLELRARRDALVLFFLGFFLVLTHFLYSQSLGMALAMGVSVWGWLTALTLAHMPVGRPPLREAGRLAARAALVGTPVMVALFLLFPRIGPLWAMPDGGGRSGLGSEMALGDVAQLALDDTIAMRLRVDGPPLPPALRYIRGPVLSQYDGERWRATPDLLAPRLGGSPTWQARGRSVRYELTVEPLRVAWLPLLDATPDAPSGLPDTVSNGLFLDREGQWRLRSPLGERVRLQAEAWPQGQRDPTTLSPGQMREALQVPPDRHPRTRAWAEALHASPEFQRASPTALSAAVLRHIATEPFAYTLQPGLPIGDPIDHFWLDHQRGFCEHYAAAYVVIMRLLGVPARIVTGYQGGDAEPVDGYVVIRQSHAHAWAEIWQAGKGWLRVDPTGAVSPDRIEHSQSLQAPAGLVGSTLDAVSPDLRQRLRRWTESLDNRWNQWVLGYGRQQQFNLLEHLGWDSPDLAQLGQTLAVLVALLGLAGAAWAWHDARRRSPWQRLQALMANELDRLDIDVADHADPAQLARRLQARHGAAAEAVARTLLDLQARRYGPTTVGVTPHRRDRWPDWEREFRQRCAELRAQLARRP